MINNELMIRNFKSVKDLTLNCKRVNIFIGEPNTGKSNILEAIGILSALGYGSPGPFSRFVRYEVMTDLFWDHDLSNKVEIVLSRLALKMTFASGNFNIYAIAPTDEPIGSVLAEVQYDYEGRVVGGRQDTRRFSSFKFYRFARRTTFPNPKSDFLNPPDGDNLLQVVLTRKELKKILGDMFARFDYRVVFQPHEGKIEIQKEYEDIIFSIPFSLVSETLQRMSFYLAAIYSNHESVITFEEPEAHAFPYYTKNLAERIALDANKNQYFIATHNPYFLTSILEKTPKDEVATFLTFLEHHQTKVKTLSEENKKRILKMDTDVFFNIEQFLGKDEAQGS